MFGGSTSPSKEKGDSYSSSPGADNEASRTDGDSPGREKRNPSSPDSAAGESDNKQNHGGEKNRFSSSVSKAAALFASARDSLHFPGLRDSLKDQQATQTPFQALGSMDPALAVPQGPLNNSAGESLSTPHSSFRVGVTEDRNKKCRRTMEDTHSYLYNFLGTPLPPPKNESSPQEASTDAENSQNKSAQLIETDNGYFAIFDGHAGTFAAEWCGKKLHLILEEIMRKNPNAPVPELLDQAFTSVDQQLEKLPLKNSGCTAIAAVLRWEDRPCVIANADSAATGNNQNTETEQEQSNSEISSQTKPRLSIPGNSAFSASGEQASSVRARVLYTANVGDARIILCRNGKALRLSYDHKGSDENEGRRITNAGGLILNNRVNGVLAVTRALGDSYMKDLVTGHPYTTETVIQPDEDSFIILACDGLWDVCSDQEAVELIKDVRDPQAASKTLVDHALSRFSTDNLSIMVVRLDTKATEEGSKNPPSPAAEPAESTNSTSNPNAVSETDKIVETAKRHADNTEEGSEQDPVASFIARQANSEHDDSEPEVSLPGNGGVDLNAATATSSDGDKSSNPG